MNIFNNDAMNATAHWQAHQQAVHQSGSRPLKRAKADRRRELDKWFINWIKQLFQLFN